MWYLVLLIGVYVWVYTMSYGIWEWKMGNKTAGVMIFLLCVVSAVFPFVKIFA